MSIRLSFIKVDMNMILCSMQRMAPAYRSKAKDDWDENGGWVHHTGRNPVTTEQTQAKAQEKPTQQNGASSYIGVAKAKEIVLQKVPGATITKIELERDDGRVAYEGEAQKGKVEYELISTLTPVRSSLGKKSKAITAAAAHSCRKSDWESSR